MLQVDGIGFTVGPPAPARLVIGLAKVEIKSRLKMKMVRRIVMYRGFTGLLAEHCARDTAITVLVFVYGLLRRNRRS